MGWWGGGGGEKLGIKLKLSFSWGLGLAELGNNPHLNFVKGTVLGDKEQGVGIRDMR